MNGDIGNRHVVMEIMSFLPCKYQVAKAIVALSKRPPDTFRPIRGRPMSQQEAKRLVDEAHRRISIADLEDQPDGDVR